MSLEEFKFLDKSIPVKEQKEATSKLKIRSYKQKLRFMEEKNIPQKPIDEVLKHLFNENKKISKKTLTSISKIIFITSARIIILITNEGQEIFRNRGNFINDYGWFFFVSNSEEEIKKKNSQKKTPKVEETLSTTDYKFEENTIILN